MTYRALCERNGTELYRRRLIPGYGHIDCIYGENTYRDVYPIIVEALDTDRS